MEEPFKRSDAHKAVIERLQGRPNPSEANATAALAFAVLAAGQYIAAALLEVAREIRHRP